MAKDYKVRYNDGRLQTITADRWISVGDHWSFSLNGQDTAIIAKKSVESITDADVPDPQEPEAPEVEVAEMQRPRRH